MIDPTVSVETLKATWSAAHATWLAAYATLLASAIALGIAASGGIREARVRRMERRERDEAAKLALRYALEMLLMTFTESDGRGPNSMIGKLAVQSTLESAQAAVRQTLAISTLDVEVIRDALNSSGIATLIGNDIASWADPIPTQVFNERFLPLRRELERALARYG